MELWAYSRRSPFLPWTGLDPLSWHPIAIRRAEWLQSIVDWLDRRGWATQHWRPAGRWPNNVVTLPGRKQQLEVPQHEKKEMRG
jgi:hypothetical protein